MLEPDNLPGGYLAAYYPELMQSFDEAELAALLCDGEWWLREAQRPPHDDWIYCGWLGGRGAGKSFGALHTLQREVELGNATNIAIVAQDEQRAYQVAVENLQQIAAPWAMPELCRDQLVWPNSAVATVYTPESPKAIRGPSFDFSYASEVNFWSAHTGLEAWNNLTTATRVGRARVVWDSSPQGDNEIVQLLVQMNAADLVTYAILHGSMLDSPALDQAYIRRESFKLGGPGAQKFEEEVRGRVYTSAHGAAYTRDEIEKTRVHEVPRDIDVKLVSVDPATTVDPRSDLSGIVVLARDRAGHIYGVDDLTDRLDPDAVCGRIIDQHFAGASTALVEANRGGLWLNSTLRALAAQRGVTLKELAADDRIPRWQRGTLYYKSLTARVDKMRRALPAAAFMRIGKAHIVGVLSSLESQLRTYAGKGESPNAFDAWNQGVCELANLHGEIVPSSSARSQRTAAELAAHKTLIDRLRQAKPRSIT